MKISVQELRIGEVNAIHRNVTKYGPGKSLLCARWCDVHFAFFLYKLELTIEQVAKTFPVMSLNWQSTAPFRAIGSKRRDHEMS